MFVLLPTHPDMTLILRRIMKKAVFSKSSRVLGDVTVTLSKRDKIRSLRTTVTAKKKGGGERRNEIESGFLV